MIKTRVIKRKSNRIIYLFNKENIEDKLDSKDFSIVYLESDDLIKNNNEVILEFNDGGHFNQIENRILKGLKWILKK